MSNIFFKYEIPNSWITVVSSEILDIRDGTHDSPKYVQNGGVPLITSKNLKEGKINFEKVNYISQEDHDEISKRSQVQPGDILFAMIGTIGNPVIIRGDEIFSIKNVGLFRKNDQLILPRLLQSFLNSKSFEKQMIERKLLNGTTQRFIPLGNLRNIILPLPPLPEQRRIVSKIEELFSSLDKGVESLKTARQQLKVYRQSVLKWAFEGRLTNCSSIEWVRLGELCTNVEYGSATKSKESGTTPVLRMGNIQNGVFDWDDLVYTSDEVEIKKYLLQKGDVLFNRTNSPEWVGKTAIYKGERPAIFAGYLIRINYLKDRLNPSYLNYFLNSQTAKNHGNSVKSFGVNQSNINGTKLKEYPFPICSLTEQQAIVSEIESRLSVCDKIEESITQSLLQAEALRQSILKKAFEGKLVPQDSSDEPASVLLERIKAEREKNSVMPKAKKVKKSQQTEIAFETV